MNAPKLYLLKRDQLHLIVAITLSILSTNFHYFGEICYRKFATGRYNIVSPPNAVCVTTLPCKDIHWFRVDKVTAMKKVVQFIGSVCI